MEILFCTCNQNSFLGLCAHILSLSNRSEIWESVVKQTLDSRDQNLIQAFMIFYNGTLEKQSAFGGFFSLCMTLYVKGLRITWHLIPPLVPWVLSSTSKTLRPFWWRRPASHRAICMSEPVKRVETKMKNYLSGSVLGILKSGRAHWAPLHHPTQDGLLCQLFTP